MKTVTVAVTGAAGQIGYSLLFRLAAGEPFGRDTRVNLRLLELPVAIKGAEGTALELLDCAFPTLGSVDSFDDPSKAFDGCNWVLMVGSQPRGPGMERSDLIKANGPIFVAQGQALERAARDVQIVVVGNPCNTNALIALRNAQDVPTSRFSAMTALDENRAKAQLALRAKVDVKDVTNVAIWGNHSTTMYPDFENAKIKGKKATSVMEDRPWLEEKFIPLVQNRGAEIIAVRGKSSAASAASACLDHVRKFITKTPDGDWFSAAILNDKARYGAPKDVMFSFPLRSKGNGEVEVVEGLPISKFGEERIKKTGEELLKEKSVVENLLR